MADYDMFIDWFNKYLNPFNYDFNARAGLTDFGPGFGDLLTDEQKNQWIYNASGFPFIGDYYRYMDYQQYLKDYFANTGFDWSNVEYPSMLPGSGTSGRAIGSIIGVSSFAPILSKNLKTLYR